ncbi:PIN domain-containing protein [Aliarcobacter cryaerophilus]|uniref:hypothetical protein n=1 Tax=Aliarcobacter cryaerophilus TaxID=28198 RepID=UPI0021B652BF|nr:hypothetical protein [Aliarcobacter cryaerophilus]MCT7519031.1 hypothetical protein [Aliarcobacter cryaerophilus]
MLYDKVIIDTNLLLLLIIGSVDDGIHINKSSRLNDYDIDDYDNIVKIINNTKEIYITPYIATEVSNLIDLKGNLKERSFEICREIFKNFKQVDIDIYSDINENSFIYFGLADASLVRLAPNYNILTADNRLLVELYKSCSENILPYELVRQN